MQNPLINKVALVLASLDSMVLDPRSLSKKSPGPTCLLDQETFDLLSVRYESGHFGEAIVEGFKKIKDLMTNEQLLKAHEVASQKRRASGKHAVSVRLTAEEHDCLSAVAVSSSLKKASLLVATSFVYFRIPNP